MKIILKTLNKHLVKDLLREQKTHNGTHKQTYCGLKHREKNIKNEGPYVLLLLK